MRPSHPARRLRPLAAALLGLTAGCAMSPATRERPPLVDATQEVAPEMSLLRLPAGDAPAPLAVWRKIDLGWLSERVVLANDTALPYENRVEVRTIWRGAEASRLFRPTFRTPFTDNAVGKLVAAELKGATSVSEPAEGRNARGPYGYVTARFADGTSCIHVWQTAATTATVTGKLQPYAVSMRFCDPRRPPAELLALFDSLEVQLNV